jgi:hypothetical protein
MDWMNQLGGLLGQYAGANAQQHPQNVDNDFDQFSQQAPQSALSQGLAGAFRSQQTPPFGNMVSNLFANSSGQQRASILNTLLAAAGPMVLQQVMARMRAAVVVRARAIRSADSPVCSAIWAVAAGNSNRLRRRWQSRFRRKWLKKLPRKPRRKTLCD